MSSVMAIYTVAIIFSVIIAWLLIRLSRTPARPKRAVDSGFKKERSSVLNASGQDSLKQVILDEIKEEPFLRERSEEISNRLVSIFAGELENRTNLGRQEFDRRYGSLLDNAENSWKKYKKVLVDQRDTEAVVRSVAEGLIVLNAKGDVIMVNAAAEKMLGVAKKDVVGRSIMDSAKTKSLVALIRGPSGKADKDIEVFSQDNETKKVLRSSNAIIEDENGKTIGMISVLRDVTKQKQLDDMKSNFVSTVTHELRTPLIATQKAISMLLDKDNARITEDVEKQFLSIADRNLKRLGLLIDDLLDLSKLESGKMDLRREIVGIDKIIDESVETLGTWARAKSIVIEKKIQGGLPQVNVDPNRINQVLNNLIGNAIKFTPNEGVITVEAALESDTGDLRVSVEDTGTGIEKENLPRIFDKFYQIGERAPTDISGTGIGLSIAKEIVELHGGEIWAESELYQGARLSFRLKTI
ncbi:MAG: ATP-binding protein [Candidatus Omnitrophota bacterium]